MVLNAQYKQVFNQYDNLIQLRGKVLIFYMNTE